MDPAATDRSVIAAPPAEFAWSQQRPSRGSTVDSQPQANLAPRWRQPPPRPGEGSGPWRPTGRRRSGRRPAAGPAGSRRRDGRRRRPGRVPPETACAPASPARVGASGPPFCSSPDSECDESDHRGQNARPLADGGPLVEQGEPAGDQHQREGGRDGGGDRDQPLLARAGEQRDGQRVRQAGEDRDGRRGPPRRGQLRAAEPQDQDRRRDQGELHDAGPEDRQVPAGLLGVQADHEGRDAPADHGHQRQGNATPRPGGPLRGLATRRRQHHPEDRQDDPGRGHGRGPLAVEQHRQDHRHRCIRREHGADDRDRAQLEGAVQGDVRHGSQQAAADDRQPGHAAGLQRPLARERRQQQGGHRQHVDHLDHQQRGRDPDPARADGAKEVREAEPDCRQLTNTSRRVHTSLEEAPVDLSLYTDMRPAPGADLRRHYQEVLEEARLAERLGFHGVWTTEQHGVDDGYLPAQLPALAAFAMRTSRLRLGTGVILLPLAQPRRVVEEACVVDVLSGGRLTLGVGAGNYAHEFRAFGVPRERRGRILEESIRFVRPGLGGQPLPDGLPVNVQPVQRPIPLVVGGLAEPAVDRAARLAEGHFAYAFMDPAEELTRLWSQRLGPALERHGRAPSGFRVVAAVVLWVSDDFEPEWRQTVGPAFLYQQRRYRDWDAGLERAEGYLDRDGADLAALIPRMLVGPPTEIVERLAALRAAYPLDELVFWYRLPGVSHELAREHLERVAERVLPAVSEATGTP